MRASESRPDGPESESHIERIARFNANMVDDSQHWRELASKALAKAGKMADSEAKQAMPKSPSSTNDL